ncbi:hypothetical protein DCC81_19475 [Chitinophaga parva]|uniref:Uncharacterized protein n=1 Tax=Chitinophaga parva TaxID=2169414 RepID=A0A2T7BBZ5_9BACT|nr:hypothetical protein [Chitinophaga parva]PUZ22617.1 hypothetical protein DCC81_19475 [Chitinophaga parva]
MGALEFIGMNDVLQLQLWIKKAAGYLDKLRLDYEPAHLDLLEKACGHLYGCERLLYQLDLPHLFRFTLAKQKALSTLHLLELRGQIRHRQAGRGGEALVKVMRRAGPLQVVRQYTGPLCAN